MNKYILFAILLILLPFQVLADEEVEVPHELNQKEEVTMQEATQDLTNRFVLAFFGKEGLRFFVPYEIENIENEIVDQYISPFPNFYRFMGYTFYLVAFLAFFISLFYLSYLIYDGVFKSQKSGEMLGESWNSLFLVIKVSLALILTAPVLGFSGVGYNGTQYLVFYTFGKSKVAGDEVIYNFSKDNPTTSPEIPMPKDYSAMSTVTSKMLFFAECLNENNIQPVNLRAEEYIQGSQYNIIIRKNDCYFNASYPLMESLMEEINNNEDIGNFINENYSLNSNLFDIEDGSYGVFKSAISEKYREITLELLNKAYSIAEVFMARGRRASQNTLGNELLHNFNLLSGEDFENSQMFDGGDSQWYNTCNSFYNIINNFNTNSDTVSDFESYVIWGLGSYCLSYNLMENIVFPNNETERNFILREGRDFYLYCRDQEYYEGGANDSLNSCFQKYCGNLNGDFSQVYQCAYSIKLLDMEGSQSEFDNLGFLVFGATIYSRFTNINPEIIKSALNDIEFKQGEGNFLLEVNIMRSKSQNSYNSFNVNVGEPHSNNYSNYNRDNILSGVPPYDLAGEIKGDIENNNHGSFKNSFNRISQCINSPLSFQGNFVCGSVIQEINKLGVSIIDSSIEYYTGKMIGQSHRMAARRAERNSSVTINGGVRRGLSKFAESSAVRFIVSGSFLVLAEKMLDIEGEDDFDNNASSDYFSYGTTNFFETMRSGLNENISPISGSSALLMGYMQGIANVDSKIINFLIGSMIFFGLFMAFIIPLIPFWIFTVAAINIISLFIMKMYTLSFLSAFLMKPSKDSSSDENLNTFANTIFQILFKIPFLIIGLIVSWLLTNILISNIIKIINIDNLFFFEFDGLSFQTLIAFIFYIIYAIVYVYILLKFISMTVGLIDNFEQMSMSLVTGQKYSFQPKDTFAQIFGQSKSYFYYGSQVKGKLNQMDKSNSEKAKSYWNKLKKDGGDVKENIKNFMGKNPQEGENRNGNNGLRGKLNNKEGGDNE